MKNLIRIVILLAGFLAVSAPVAPAAEAAPGGGLERQERLAEAYEKLAARLQLTEQQRPSVEAILREDASRRRAVMEKYRGQRNLRALRELRRELEPVREDTEQKLSAILSPAQMKEFRKAREEMRDKARKELRDRRGNGR